MADDYLSAELDAIRNRAALAYASPARMAESAADVPRLLAALDKVLSLTADARLVALDFDPDGNAVQLWTGLDPAKVREAIACELTGEGDDVTTD